MCINEILPALGYVRLMGFLKCEAFSANSNKSSGQTGEVDHSLQESGQIKFTFISCTQANCLMHNKWLININ